VDTQQVLRSKNAGSPENGGHYPVCTVLFGLVALITTAGAPFSDGCLKEGAPVWILDSH
jgi:hypothetical protein